MTFKKSGIGFGLCLIPLMLAMLSVLGGCAHTYKTVVEPGNTQLSDDTHKQGPVKNVTHATKITVTPSTQPAAAEASTQPSVIKVGDKAVQAPPGSTVTVETTDNDTGTPETYSHSRQAFAKGAGLSTDAVAGADKFTTETPSVVLPPDSEGGGGGGGETTSSFSWLPTIVSQASKAAWVFWILGALCIIAAGVVGWVEVRAGGSIFNVGSMVLLGLGLLLITIGVVMDKYPWMLVFLPIGLVIGGVIYWKHRQQQKTTQTVTAAVEGSSPATQDEVKSNVSFLSGAQPAIKTLITQAKTKAMSLVGLLQKKPATPAVTLPPPTST